MALVEPLTQTVSGYRLAAIVQDVERGLAPAAQAAFRQAFEDLLKSKDFRAFLARVRASDYMSEDLITRLQAEAGFQVPLGELQDVIQDALYMAGRSTAATMGMTGRLAFDLVNPRVVEWARMNSGRLVTNVSNSVREMIRTTTERAWREGIGINELTRRLEKYLPLLPQHAVAVDSYRQMLLGRGTQKGIANKRADEYADRLIRWRANTVARSEVIHAADAGRLEYWRQMSDSGYIDPHYTMRQWNTAMDERTCSVCGPMDKVTILFDAQYDTANGMLDIPHAHPNCRCSESLVFLRKPIAKVDDIGAVSKGESAGHPFRGNQYTRGKNTGGPDALASQVGPLIMEHGGVTVKLGTGFQPHTGFIVATHGHELALDAKDVTANAIRRYMDDNKADLNKPGRYLGGWIDRKRKKVYLDVSERVMSRDNAVRRGKARDQISIVELREDGAHEIWLKPELAPPGADIAKNTEDLIRFVLAEDVTPEQAARDILDMMGEAS